MLENFFLNPSLSLIFGSSFTYFLINTDQVGKLCPLLGGTGPATMVLVSLLNVYYCVIVGWAIFYLIVSLATLPTLPWDTCGRFYTCINNNFN